MYTIDTSRRNSRPARSVGRDLTRPGPGLGPIMNPIFLPRNVWKKHGLNPVF